MSEPRKSPAPAGLKTRGKRFWHETLDVWDLTKPEREILNACCRLLDEIEDLQGAVEREGVTTAGSTGQTRAHPALAEARASRALLAKLLAQLELPDERGETLSTPTQARARHAAQARWAQERDVMAAKRANRG